MAEPPAKKLKEDYVPRFVAFRKDKIALRQLGTAYTCLRVGVEHLYLRPMSIRVADAVYCKSFSQACCYGETFEDDGVKPTFAVGCVFKYGMGVLHNYIEENHGRIPSDENARAALQKLLRFMSTSHDDLIKPLAGVEEDKCELAVRIAQHLLSELAVENKYTLDGTHYHNKELKKKFKESFDNTSFGVSDAWHGYVDILMEQMPVSLYGAADADTDADAGDTVSDFSDTASITSVTSSVEVKLSNKFHNPDLQQMLSETVVFSFLQKKECRNLNNFLIPSLGICSEKLVVHLYDCENDVLLASCKLPLFEYFQGKTIPESAVVFLWLTLNYKYFCSGITEEMQKYKSGFHELVKPHLKKYQEEVHRPCAPVQQDISADYHGAFVPAEPAEIIHYYDSVQLPP